MDSLKKYFGKRKVTQELKTSLVQDVFSNVAKNYDVMNDLMSFGSHRLWKSELINFMNIQKFDRIIDVGSGTGNLIDLILKKKITNNIYSTDLNGEMLRYSKKRLREKKVVYVKANAEELPFSNDYFDKYMISFCLRNVTDIKKALKEAYRIIKPGGAFYCLEFSLPETDIVNSIYRGYKKYAIPFMGETISKNKQAYEYLQESIDLFPDQESLLNQCKKIGFDEAKYINMFNGIVSIHTGFKL